MALGAGLNAACVTPPSPRDPPRGRGEARDAHPPTRATLIRNAGRQNRARHSGFFMTWETPSCLALPEPGRVLALGTGPVGCCPEPFKQSVLALWPTGPERFLALGPTGPPLLALWAPGPYRFWPWGPGRAGVLLTIHYLPEACGGRTRS